MEELLGYWPEFLLLATAHLAAVISPGPDFTVVMRQSLVYGRKVAIITSCGIGSAISIHVTYSLVGIEILNNSQGWIFSLVQVAGALYLGYLGFLALQASKQVASKEQLVATHEDISTLTAFKQGFLTNALNPKATLFFLFLFTSIVDQDTPIGISIFYGAWMIVVTALWFVLLSLILSHSRVRHFFISFGHWLDRTFGIILLGLALFILLDLLL